jgi:hypothetical protein
VAAGGFAVHLRLQVTFAGYVYVTGDFLHVLKNFSPCTHLGLLYYVK